MEEIAVIGRFGALEWLPCFLAGDMSVAPDLSQAPQPRPAGYSWGRKREEPKIPCPDLCIRELHSKGATDTCATLPSNPRSQCVYLYSPLCPPSADSQDRGTLQVRGHCPFPEPFEEQWNSSWVWSLLCSSALIGNASPGPASSSPRNPVVSR